ncbi:hypothetical protein INT48_002391 [Thamnidium elegans]|uniref:Uncharacterized protein n=1 Tax=Thamnidium elegans TaxID=101142 RepID=A0A8H7SWK4_9FUNG|nr:hypothetical protein INT48_002391 [Thamnidium elegans]
MDFRRLRKLPKRNVRTKVDDNETKHIEELSQTELKSTESKCVLIDPGRRDIMFCTKETSTVEHRETFIYTKNHHSGRSKHFRILRKSAQSAIVKEAEATISGTESESVNLEKFTRYVKTRATVSSTLYDYYENEFQNPIEVYFPGSSFEFRVDEKRNI